MDLLNERKIIFISDKENIDESSPTSRLLTDLLATIYEFERSNMLEKPKEGIAIAKKKGNYKGKSKIKMAENLGISKPTLNKLLKTKVGG